ncbi:MAG: crotonase/enoyl-CoA hydratase family protein [Chloroflexi bacterium]|nr:crotonase/enoyl-CoA hydratase family protein [Chloroflexota bacterium]
MDYFHIMCEVSEKVMTVTLNRPEQLNTFTPVMRAELIDALDKADEDDDVRVVIVTGAGRAFCAGADFGNVGETFNYGKRDAEDTLETHRDNGGLVALRIYDMKKPVIAAINGPVVGVGITMTLPMDIRLASENAKIGFVFTRRGVVPEACSSWFLPRIVGMSKAAEWILTGRVFSAQEAYEGGLVSEVLTPDSLMPRAREIALEIAQNTSGVSVALARQLLWKMAGADHPMEAHKIDSKCMYWTGKREDTSEGILSFLGKRAPQFTMKPSKDMPEFYPWWDDKVFE